MQGVSASDFSRAPRHERMRRPRTELAGKKGASLKLDTRRDNGLSLHLLTLTQQADSVALPAFPRALSRVDLPPAPATTCVAARDVERL